MSKKCLELDDMDFAEFTEHVRQNRAAIEAKSTPAVAEAQAEADLIAEVKNEKVTQKTDSLDLMIKNGMIDPELGNLLRDYEEWKSSLKR